MIQRYTRPEMGKLWSEEKRFQTWLDVELAVLETLAEDEVIPADCPPAIRKKAKINVARIQELEDSLRHDVISFTTSIAEQVGGHGRFFHFGLTSSDVVDTALAVMTVNALNLIHEDLTQLLTTLRALALKYKTVPTIGRTHGIHAEPTSFGLKFLGAWAEFRRHRKNIKRVTKGIARGKLSGAVGAYGALSPDVEKRALKRLGLKPEVVATQVVPRDRHADVMCVLAQIGASIERLSVELRHLQRTEVSEIEEEFGAEQKGSSAMPHKKNPISAENLTGCARLLRGYAVACLENVALWHERDISHSSVERVAFPDAFILADYALIRLKGVLTRIRVKERQVEQNLNLTQGVFFSGHVLLALVQKGVSREDGYRIVQRAAHRALEEARPFAEILREDGTVKAKFSGKELSDIFSIQRYLRHVDQIYDRVLKDDSRPH